MVVLYLLNLSIYLVRIIHLVRACIKVSLLRQNTILICSLTMESNRRFDERAAAKEPTELFTKNTGLC